MEVVESSIIDIRLGSKFVSTEINKSLLQMLLIFDTNFPFTMQFTSFTFPFFSFHPSFILQHDGDHVLSL